MFSCKVGVPSFFVFLSGNAISSISSVVNAVKLSFLGHTNCTSLVITCTADMMFLYIRYRRRILEIGSKSVHIF